MQLGNALVSLRRLTQYLVLEERNDTVEQMDIVGLDVQGGQFYWSEPPASKKLDGVKGAPGQGKKRSLLSVFGGLRLRKGPAIGTGPANGSGMALHACALGILEPSFSKPGSCMKCWVGFMCAFMCARHCSHVLCIIY